MFSNKKFIAVVTLLVIFGCTFEAAAGNAFLSWRIFSNFSDTRESIAKAKAEEERKAAAEKKAAAERKIAAAKKAAAEKKATERKAAAEKKAAAKKAAADKKAAEERRIATERALENLSEFAANACHKIAWYLPNRLVDLLDCFSIEAGIGEIGLNVQFTRYATFGAGIGYSGMIGWSNNRQLGVYTQRIWNADFLNVNGSEVYRENVLGNYKPFFQTNSGLIDMDYYCNSRAVDPYAIGVRAGFYPTIQFQFHPVELADFVAGLLFIDFKNDDK